MVKRSLSTLALACLAFGSMGSTDCQYFSEVTVPAHDSTGPEAWFAVFADGGYQKLSEGRTRFTYQLPNRNALAYAIAAAIDYDSGARRVRMPWTVRVLCCPDIWAAECLDRPYRYLSGEEQGIQHGGVGSRVSTGVYTGKAFTAQGFEYLCEGDSLAQLRFDWTIRAENMLGSWKESSRGRIEWHP